MTFLRKPCNEGQSQINIIILNNVGPYPLKPEVYYGAPSVSKLENYHGILNTS